MGGGWLVTATAERRAIVIRNLKFIQVEPAFLNSRARVSKLSGYASNALQMLSTAVIQVLLFAVLYTETDLETC